MAKYRYHRLDANHIEIRDGLQARGVSVCEKGPLDLLVGFRGVNMLIEIKTAKGKLRPSQEAFLKTWHGSAYIVRSLAEACEIIGVSF